MWITPLFISKRSTVEVKLGGNNGLDGKYKTTQKNRIAQSKASASIKLRMSFRSVSWILLLAVWLTKPDGSRTNNGPRRKPPAFPNWLKTLLIPVAVVLSLGGNLNIWIYNENKTTGTYNFKFIMCFPKGRQSRRNSTHDYACNSIEIGSSMSHPREKCFIYWYASNSSAKCHKQSTQKDSNSQTYNTICFFIGFNF